MYISVFLRNNITEVMAWTRKRWNSNERNQMKNLIAWLKMLRWKIKTRHTILVWKELHRLIRNDRRPKRSPFWMGGIKRRVLAHRCACNPDSTFLLIYIVWKKWNIWYNNYAINCLAADDSIEVISSLFSIHLSWSKLIGFPICE